MQIEIMPVGPLETNCYLLHNSKQAVVIDPGGEAGLILERLDRMQLELTHILNTHLHFDHTYANAALAAATGVKILAGEAERLLAETELARGGMFGLPLVEPFTWEALAPGIYSMLGQQCEVLPTPGHSPGSLSYYFPAAAAAFVGDVIFRGAVGRTDFAHASHARLIQSIESQILSLPDETTLYPGHGPATTVKREKKSNPYL